MRILALTVLLSLPACASLDSAMPRAASALELAKDRLAKADKVYQALCVPPLEPQLSTPCAELRTALATSTEAVNVVVDAYTAVNSVLEAAQAGAQ